MLDRFSWQHGGSVFAIVLPVTAAVVALASLLAFAWEFDLETSPAWQVAVHHLMLGPPEPSTPASTPAPPTQTA